MKQDLLKTGTTTVGIVCKDGVILAADKRSTMGSMIASGNQEKVKQITNFVGSTQSGVVSAAQNGTKLAKAESSLIKIRKQREPTVKEVASIMASISYNQIRSSGIGDYVGFMIGGYDEKEGNQIYNIGMDGSLTRFKNFDATGSGSIFAYGVLEADYKEGISVKEGAELAIKAINSAIQRDTASGNGVDVYKITKEGGFEHVTTKMLNTRLD